MNSKNSVNSDAIKSIYLKKSRFTGMLIEENALDQDGFEHWIFCQGMLYNSPDKWWGDLGLRDYPHEGMDLCLYKDDSGKIRRVNEKTRIPVMQDGVIKAIIKDFLGETVIIEHEPTNKYIGRLLFFYAHINPHPEIENGLSVQEGDILGTLADTSHSKSNILPHLHLSLGLSAAPISYDGFVWNVIRNPEMITLLDPLETLDWPYQVLAGEIPDVES